MTSSTSSYTAFTHIRLFGPVAVKAYPFGPVAVRIEHATITIGDAKAAPLTHLRVRWRKQPSRSRPQH